MLVIKHLFFIFFFLATITSNCTGQISDKEFIVKFYKCLEPIGEEGILYFEAIKIDDQYMISSLKGVHPKKIYDRLYDALVCIDSSKISSESVKFIFLSTKLGLSQGEVQDRIEKFKQNEGLGDDVQYLLTTFGERVR